MTHSLDSETTPLLQDDEESVQSGKRSGPGFSYLSLIALWWLNMVPGLAFEIIYPFVNQMIIEIGVTDDPEKVGFYSGIIESIFSCVQILTILPCSYAADKLGRKPVIIFGISGVGISMIFFGLSTSFRAMLISRSLGGALGGSWAAIRVAITELVPKERRGFAFAGSSMSYRIGQIVGLPLGGLLAHPERHAVLFQTKFWTEHPFALPCFTGAAFALLSGVSGSILVKETLKKSSSHNVHGNKSHVAMAPVSALLTRSVITVLHSNIGMVAMSEMLFSLYPLFGFTPIESGGLGLTEAEIGFHMSVRAILHIGAMFLFPVLHRRLGAVKLYQLSLLLCPVTIVFFPIANSLAVRYGSADNWQVLTAVGLMFGFWSISGFGWPAMSLIVSDATPSPEALARLNGVYQMSVVLPQAVAPALGTSLFAFSIKNDIMGGAFVWIALFTCGCLLVIHSLSLRETDPHLEKSMAVNQVEESESNV